MDINSPAPKLLSKEDISFTVGDLINHPLFNEYLVNSLAKVYSYYSTSILDSSSRFRRNEVFRLADKGYLPNPTNSSMYFLRKDAFHSDGYLEKWIIELGHILNKSSKLPSAERNFISQVCQQTFQKLISYETKRREQPEPKPRKPRAKPKAKVSSGESDGSTGKLPAKRKPKVSRKGDE